MQRRDLLLRLVGGFSLVGIAGFLFPFMRSLFPKGQEAMTLDVNLESLGDGESRVVQWLGRNVYILRRGPVDIAALATNTESLADPDSDRSAQPTFARNGIRSRRDRYLVVYANCTHLGCEVELNVKNAVTVFQCPCHQSEFDAAGRVRVGAAARLNLEVPDYDYIAGDTIRLTKS